METSISIFWAYPSIMDLITIFLLNKLNIKLESIFNKITSLHITLKCHYFLFYKIEH